MSAELRDGMLLVARRGLMDPNFYRTVILICRHDDQEGTVGLVLNRCSDQPVGKALSGLPAAEGRQEPLWIGGPVDGRNLWILHRRADLLVPGHQVQEEVYFTHDPQVVRKILETSGRDRDGTMFRLFVGYAGWGEGQLADEIFQGAWDVVPGGPAAIFSESPGDLWAQMSIRASLPGAARPEAVFHAWLN